MNKIIFLIVFVVITNSLVSQVKGKEEKEFNKDTVFIFESPRPILTYNQENKPLTSAYGLDLTLTDAGFGAGFFLNWQLSDNILGFANLYITGARNTDEFDQWSYENNQFQVYNKISRLYRFPLTFGLQYFLFQGELSESLQPFVSAGFGPTFIVSAPYTVDRVPNKQIVGWFESFSYADLYTKLGGFVSVGAYIGSMSKSFLGVHIKYYYIPFGENGLESVSGMPIKDFGGVFLSLSFGGAF